MMGPGPHMMGPGPHMMGPGPHEVNMMENRMQQE